MTYFDETKITCKNYGWEVSDIVDKPTIFLFTSNFYESKEIYNTLNGRVIQNKKAMNLP